MVTLSKNNQLPKVVFEVQRELEYTGSAEFRADPTRCSEVLTVMYRGEHGGAMRVVEADFEDWDDGEKTELVQLLSKFCIKGLEKIHGIK